MNNLLNTFDASSMKKALELAEGVKGLTSPNPAVGAVIVNNGSVAGTGATSPAGGPHAEIHALKMAGSTARGATLYVTLEPCCHHGRTPPCTNAIIAAGVTRVVVAQSDPNPRVKGKGIARLRRKGIRVDIGLMRKQAHFLNEDYCWSIVRQQPWITLKLAMTLDGRIADVQGMSKWISSVAARKRVQQLRRNHAAVMVGRRTLLRDNSRLTVRSKTIARPVRIVVGTQTALGVDSHFALNASHLRSIVVVSGGRGARSLTKESGVEFWYTGEKHFPDSMQRFFKRAYEEGITSILVEGGGRLASLLCEHGFVNRVCFFYGNRILGGGMPGLAFAKARPLANARKLHQIAFEHFGDTWMVTGLVQRK
ncbi:MAG: bifunctional diaminohydroxyphosphoribosylaminopyrimidine deaminase/5-amino-6-(5-phosphoribosylamino)uracil reductase RibD [Chitinivibrionales bacterium]|nr:bifunctional diaminohydroxyphosphoribosylaminopyrimidine deaminase/5-amino-6-(5-phosphoribosylamino)uracil reductase RibD [Chitinivibrionales bacterium]